MNEQERKARIVWLRSMELERNIKKLWWLSFADEDGFKGVVILEAFGFADALTCATGAGLNPGGEVQAMLVDPADIPEALRNRLLKKPDLAGFGVSTLQKWG